MSTEPDKSAHPDARATHARASGFVRQILRFPFAPRDFTSRLAARAPTSETGGGRWYRACAVALVAAGLLLLAYNQGWLPDWLARVTAFWPAALIIAGLAMLYTGRPALGFESPPFALERRGVEEGELWIDAGAAEVRLESLTSDDLLATGEFPSFAGPRLEVQGARARLVLDRRGTAPLLPGAWKVALSAQLPWRLHLCSGTGAMSLDLSRLPVDALDLKAWAAPVELCLPATGQGEMNLRLDLGDLTLRLPDGVGLNLRLKAGPLVGVDAAGSPLAQTAPGGWSTPDFAHSPHRFVLNVHMTAGDLRICQLASLTGPDPGEHDDVLALAT